MNHSIYGADRLTHLKIVVVALIAATAVAGVAIAARDATPEPGVVMARTYGPIVKAGQPVMVGEQSKASTIR